MPVKNGRPIGRIVEVVLPNGQKLGSGFGSIAPPPGTQGGTPVAQQAKPNLKAIPSREEPLGPMSRAA